MLVVGEIAFALVLLTGAGLLLRSLVRLQEVPTGLDTDRLLALPISPPSPGTMRRNAPSSSTGMSRPRWPPFPASESVALTNHVPLSGASADTPLEVDGAPRREDGSDEALFREVDSAYFRTAGIPIVRGRDFLPQEIAHPGDAALVNQALAARYWPGGDPSASASPSTIGAGPAGFWPADTGDGHRRSGNVRHFSLDTDFAPEVYLPYTVTVWPWMSLLVRTAGDPRSGPAVVRAVPRWIPTCRSRARGWATGCTSCRVAQQSFAYRRFITGLLGAFALPAVLLAALGIFGVVGYLVAQRSHEMAIRMALGARQVDVFVLVLREGLVLAGIGVLLGTSGAIVTTRWLTAELYETSATDPLTFVIAAGALAGISLVATVLPARRASGIDPARMLRSE